MNTVIELVKDERERQLDLLGQGIIRIDLSNSLVPPAVKIVFLTEELGEVARAVRNLYLERPDSARKVHSRRNLNEELVQLATHVLTWRSTG